MEFKEFKNRLFKEARKEGLTEFEIYFSNS